MPFITKTNKLTKYQSMKRFTLAVVGCAVALGAMAHRDVYFSVDMSEKTSGWPNASWTVNGASLEYDEAQLPYLLYTGDYSVAGHPGCVEIVHDQRAHGERNMKNLSKVFLTVSATDYADDAHVTPSVEINDEFGEKMTFKFDMLPNTYETKMVESTSMTCTVDPSEFGKVNNFKIYFDGARDGEEIDLALIGLGTDWVMPKVSSTRVVDCFVYNRGPEDMTKPGQHFTETGVTYIQGEDFDEPWINNRIGHLGTGVRNGNRLYKEDQDVSIQWEGRNQFGDGSPYGRFYENHGHIVGNRWAGNDDLLGEGDFTGGVLHDWIRGGGNGDYSYNGEYLTPGANDAPYITLENAIKNWSIWAEYTFEAEEDCLIDISLAVAANRAWYEGAIANDKYWWLDKADKGYVIDGFDGNSYQEMFHHKYMLELDGELQRTAYNAAPEFKEDGYAFLHAVRDPRKWVNNQDDVNGQKLNSYYLGVWPYPYWGEVETDGWGCGAYAYYKNDMLAKGVNEGIIPESVLNSQPSSDYVNIPVKKGRHTIKIKNMGGLSWLDEIHIKAHSGAGVDNVLADGLDGAYEGTPLYFDLQGRQIANPTKGIYLVKRGKTVTKEVVR